QAWPVLGETPILGTTSLRAASARKAAAKKRVPLQNDTWLKIECRSPLTHRPCRSASGGAPTWVRLVPLNSKALVTTAGEGSLGRSGVTAGRVPLVITSGSYTRSAPVAGFRIVACTNAPRLSVLAIVHPERAGGSPCGPVSRYGVARPRALSGWAGTMMRQDTFPGVRIGWARGAGPARAGGGGVGRAGRAALAAGAAGPGGRGP